MHVPHVQMFVTQRTSDMVLYHLIVDRTCFLTSTGVARMRIAFGTTAGYALGQGPAAKQRDSPEFCITRVNHMHVKGAPQGAQHS